MLKRKLRDFTDQAKVVANFRCMEPEIQQAYSNYVEDFGTEERFICPVRSSDSVEFYIGLCQSKLPFAHKLMDRFAKIVFDAQYKLSLCRGTAPIEEVRLPKLKKPRIPVNIPSAPVFDVNTLFDDRIQHVDDDKCQVLREAIFVALNYTRSRLAEEFPKAVVPTDIAKSRELVARFVRRVQILNELFDTVDGLVDEFEKKQSRARRS